MLSNTGRLRFEQDPIWRGAPTASPFDLSPGG
jgi:hypothetical protein